MECGFSDIFSRHICSNVAETIGVTNNPASFGAKNVQKTTFEAAEMILGPWNQQISLQCPTEGFRMIDGDMINLRGQCYDGAGDMSGVRNGLAACVTEEFPKAVYTSIVLIS